MPAASITASEVPTFEYGAPDRAGSTVRTRAIEPHHAVTSVGEPPELASQVRMSHSPGCRKVTVGPLPGDLVRELPALEPDPSLRHASSSKRGARRR